MKMIASFERYLKRKNYQARIINGLAYKKTRKFAKPRVCRFLCKF